MGILDRTKHFINVFLGNDGSEQFQRYGYGGSYGTRPDRLRLQHSNERSIIMSILTRISIDVATLDIRHVMLDDQDRYSDDIDSGLQRCLNFEPNLDQGPRAFRQDIAMEMMDSGECCIVPVDVVRDSNGDVVDIVTLRVGRIVQWFPKHVRVSLYNEETMAREEIVIPKTFVAIPDNPLYPVMNGPNSTLNRLIRKLNLLDVVDEQSSSGKLDLIIQLPYTVKGEVKQKQADERRQHLEDQMKGSQYGIAWSDATEKIVQLNRPAENNLLTQIEFLTKMLYSQLGLTEGVMDGTADEASMLNYYNRTVEPLTTSIVEAMQRSFVGLKGITKGERLRFYRDPFRLVPVGQIADIADKMTRNEILSANEVRGFMGISPSKDPKADQLINSNINPNVPGQNAEDPAAPAGEASDESSVVNSALDDVSATMELMIKDLEGEVNGSP